MLDLSSHPYFEAWTDPRTGVTSFVLTQRVAPVQQNFYFTNPSVSPDERWLWLTVAFPPAPHKTLAVVSLDPARPLIRHFPGAAFTSMSPMVAPDSSGVYFCLGPAVWFQPLAGEPSVVCTLSDDFIRQRPLTRLATHLSLSADGRYFLLDGAVGQHWFVGLGDRHSGAVSVLHEFGRHYNHAQFSPTDPTLFLICQDWWRDPVSGHRFEAEIHTWLMDVQQTRFEAVRPRDWFKHGVVTAHEFWTADGNLAWVDEGANVYAHDLTTSQTSLVWEGGLSHAHCDKTARYWCADEPPLNWATRPNRVHFYDRVAGRETQIVSEMPLPPYPRNSYHIDPHPQFSPRGTWIIYTTTVRGMVDVALAPVRQPNLARE